MQGPEWGFAQCHWLKVSHEVPVGLAGSTAINSSLPVSGMFLISHVVAAGLRSASRFTHQSAAPRHSNQLLPCPKRSTPEKGLSVENLISEVMSFLLARNDPLGQALSEKGLLRGRSPGRRSCWAVSRVSVVSWYGGDATWVHTHKPDIMGGIVPTPHVLTLVLGTPSSLETKSLRR